MDRLDELREELSDLRRAEDGLHRALDAFQSINWTGDIREPHYAEMEMEEALTQVTKRIEEIEDKVSRI
tara:strand:- start:51 stop:257 length:207 start_codon:yes stop_codon:yes gene_type:complete